MDMSVIVLNRELKLRPFAFPPDAFWSNDPNDVLSSINSDEMPTLFNVLDAESKLFVVVAAAKLKLSELLDKG